MSIFQLMPHTPISAVGLNFLGHYKVGSEDDYHRVGDVLAPKDIWKALYPDEMTGLANLAVRIQRGSRGEALKTKDEKRIAVQASDRIRFGIFFSYNDHHDVSADGEDNLGPGERVATLIDNEWESSWQDSVRVFDGVLSRVLSK